MNVRLPEIVSEFELMSVERGVAEVVEPTGPSRRGGARTRRARTMLWRRRVFSPVWEFLQAALSDPVSALLVSAESSLAAEVPQQVQARTVLSAIVDRQR